jgi:hypothetical protein
VAERIKSWSRSFIIFHRVRNGIEPALDHASEAVFDKRFKVGQCVRPPACDNPCQFEAIQNSERQ